MRRKSSLGILPLYSKLALSPFMDIQTAYRQTLDYLYGRLPMFSRIGKAALKNDLTNTIRFCEALDNPHQKFKSIHIAGTNGKGSTSHMLSAILQEAGYKVGLYTSPHLVDFRERICIDGKMISREWVVDFVEKYKDIIEEIEPSFFEITVAMAFHAFAEEQVDIAIIETGLGGRLDSTNVITPLLSVITNISYDHTDLLGNTLQEIAFEKAGIIKQQVPVVIGEQRPETERVFFEQCVHKQSTAYYAEALWDLVRVKQDISMQYFKAVNRAKREMHDLATDLPGNYQQGNLRTVLAAIDVLASSGHLHVGFNVVAKALTKVKKLTGFRGRWDILQQEPLIIADVAHNPSGIKEVINQWNGIQARQKHIVIGFVKDKDVNESLSLLPKGAVYHFCNAQIPRALPAKELQEIAEQRGLSGCVYETVADAMRNIRETLSKEDAVLIMGSFFIAGEAMEYLAVNNGMLFPSTLE